MTPFETEYLVTQYGLLAAQVVLLCATIFFYRKLVLNDDQREVRAVEGEIKYWCKCVFEGVDSPGALQRAGAKVRLRFPRHMNLILVAYDELSVEKPSGNRPVLYKFLETMELCEPRTWPSSMDFMSGKEDPYKYSSSKITAWPRPKSQWFSRGESRK